MSEKASSTQFGYEDHFQPARTRKKRKNRPPTEPPSPSVLLARASEELAGTDWLRDTLRPSLRSLTSSPLLTDPRVLPGMLRDALEDAFPASDVAPDVLCLGLGSPSSSRDARAQLALLLAACDDLRIVGRLPMSVGPHIDTSPCVHLLRSAPKCPSSIPSLWNRTAS